MNLPEIPDQESQLSVALTKLTADPKNKAAETKGSVWLTLEPFLRLEVELTDPPEFIAEAPSLTEQIELLFPNDSESRIGHKTFTPVADHRYSLAHGRPLVLGRPGPVQKLEFEVLNLMSSFPFHKAEAIVLETDEHSIDLQPLRTPEAGLAGFLHLGNRRHVRSHTGVLVPASGEVPFEKIEELRSGLALFFSLCRAALTAPVILRGYTRKDAAPEWSLADTPRIAGLRFWNSWIDVGQPERFQILYRGFWPLWTQESWKDPLERAIHWYARASSDADGPDMSLILSHSALEILSWARLVGNGNSLSEDGFQRLRSSDNIRLLLSLADIPLAIPDHMVEPKRIAAMLGHLDGPELISRTRNSILHPKTKGADELRSIVRESSQLALYYVELSLLHLCRYDGLYLNRTHPSWTSVEEPVPWTKSGA